MYREFGFKGFYRGLSICLVRSVPVGGMGFVMYELAMEKLFKNDDFPVPEHLAQEIIHHTTEHEE